MKYQKRWNNLLRNRLITWRILGQFWQIRRSCNELQAKLFFYDWWLRNALGWWMTTKCLGPDVWSPQSQKSDCLKTHSPNPDCFKTQSKKIVLGQRVNPKLLEKSWAGGTLFLRRDLDAKTVKELSVLSPNFNRTKKATTFRFASFSALSTCVESKQNTRWSWWPIGTPYHAFYTTVRYKRGNPSNAGQAVLH
jgi:hypothetical protein